jgi:hypothetical protein
VKHLAVLAATIAAHLPSSDAHAHGRGCRTDRCDHLVMHRVGREHKLRMIAPVRSWLMRVAACESGYGGPPRWSLSTGNGFYGGLQFTLSSWASVGGHGLPNRASRLEQLYRGARLLASQGPTAWPVCSR